MSKGSLYPFKVRIKDPEMCKVFLIVNQRRSSKIPSNSVALKIGKKIKPIRKDIYLGQDRRYNRSFIALPPELDLVSIKKGSAYDFIFKPKI